MTWYRKPKTGIQIMLERNPQIDVDFTLNLPADAKAFHQLFAEEVLMFEHDGKVPWDDASHLARNYEPKGDGEWVTEEDIDRRNRLGKFGPAHYFIRLLALLEVRYRHRRRIYDLRDKTQEELEECENAIAEAEANKRERRKKKKAKEARAKAASAKKEAKAKAEAEAETTDEPQPESV